MIEHGEECRNEDDGRQNLKSEIKSQMRTLLAQITKHELRSGKRVTEQPVDCIARHLENAPANIGTQHKHRKCELQAQSPADCL